MSAGYVYVLSNPSLPGIVKIGHSKRGGHSRASELYTTGIPAPFKVEFEVYCANSIAMEKRIHEYLNNYRFNDRREFFVIELHDSVKAVMNIVMCEQWGFAKNSYKSKPALVSAESIASASEIMPSETRSTDAPEQTDAGKNALKELMAYLSDDDTERNGDTFDQWKAANA